jgi:thiol-disulfide isomerase/thioredoxin
VAKKPPAKQQPVKASTGRPAGLFTWLAVGLVIVVVAALVIIKVTASSPTSSSSSNFQATDAATVTELTTVPASVFDTIGLNSPDAPVTAPIELKGQPALTGTSASGAKLPEVFYLGAEYCPYCAAERWSTIIALSRFGTWKGLGNTTSSSVDVYPSTPTFTFLKASYTSKYLVFKSIEEYNNSYNASTNPPYGKLQTPTKQEAAVFTKYDTSKYITSMTAAQDGSIPFISIGNKFVISGADYTPATLSGQSRSQIAAGLNNTTSPVTAAIIASANYQTASFCSLTNNMPAAVCTSSGVLAAKKAMKL